MEFGAILLDRGLLSQHQLEMAREAESGGKRLDHAVVEMGFVREEDALRALAEALQLRYAELSEHAVDAALLKEFPSKLIYRKNVFPLDRTNGVLQVATSDPFDIYVLDEVGTLTGLDIEPVLATREDIARLIKQNLGVGGETVDQLVAQRGDIELLDETDADTSELAEMAQEASVIRLVNEFLVEAIDLRASDVHLEPQEHSLRIRYRIDGVLHSQPMPAELNRFHAAILSRLKIMARLNIAEKRLPQDGRIRLRVTGRDVDIRVSVIPMLHGEGIVMRLLDKGRMVFNLRGIGMAEGTYATFQELIKRPHGIILVTGPTGSGKTTTLYSALNEIKSDYTKIITIEDPVEYHIDGINQIQVHSRIGLTFASGLRSILRHDPDIILVGEVRDLETADIAIQSSLTGHLVFSTLHTNDAAGAFTRLIDMGVEPFLVASTVEAVMAQRLVRTICSECKTEYQPDELPADFPDPGNTPLYRGTGCRVCRDTGYFGRTGIYELLTNSEELQRLTVENVSSGKIFAQARREGMVSLRHDGWHNVLGGITTIEEVLRVTKGDVANIA